MTQQQLAHAAGCSIAYVRLLECGFAPHASAVLPRIERALREHTPSHEQQRPGGNQGAAEGRDGDRDEG